MTKFRSKLETVPEQSKKYDFITRWNASFDGTLLPLMLTSKDLFIFVLRVFPSLCNQGLRAPSVDRLPDIGRS